MHFLPFIHCPLLLSIILLFIHHAVLSVNYPFSPIYPLCSSIIHYPITPSVINKLSIFSCLSIVLFRYPSCRLISKLSIFSHLSIALFRYPLSHHTVSKLFIFRV